MARQQPSLIDPLVDGTFRLIAPWNFFFATLIAPPPAFQEQTLTISPATLTAQQSGMFAISGGTVSLVQINRGNEVINTGVTSGLVPVSLNDSIIITYSIPPTVEFVPN